MITDYLKLLGGLVLIGFGTAVSVPLCSVFIIVGTVICTCIILGWKHRWEQVSR